MSRNTKHQMNHTTGSIYVGVFIALIALTGLSFWLASSEWAAENLNTRFAMFGISAVKAMLVVLCFMHLWWEANWKYVVTVPTTCMAVLLVALLFPDIGFRFGHYTRERLERAPTPAADLWATPGDESGQTNDGIGHFEESD